MQADNPSQNEREGIATNVLIALVMGRFRNDGSNPPHLHASFFGLLNDIGK